MRIIKRDYLDKIVKLTGSNLIKIITGIRRSGKSFLLKEFSEFLMENYKNVNLIYIDFYNLEFEYLEEYHELYNYVMNSYEDGKKNVLIIDEVQLCKKFEIAINSIYNQNKFDIYLTGSNAFLLSSDLATLFLGRYIEIQIQPFSYNEFLTYFYLDDNKENFDEYFNIGGFSGSYDLPSEERKSYVFNIYKTIINRDLIKRKKIRYPSLLDKIANYLIDNIGNLTSIRNITRSISTNGTYLNDKTISNYLEYLCESFLFYRVKRYDIKGKKIFSSSEKYYLVDQSFRLALLGTKDVNYGRTYENMVALELIRRGYELYVGVLYNTEVDFIAIRNNEKIYIQVSDNIENEGTLKREISPLLMIKDCYPKIILANTNHEEYYLDGIKIIDLRRWLNNKLN